MWCRSIHENSDGMQSFSDDFKFPVLNSDVAVEMSADFLTACGKTGAMTL